MGRGGQVNSDRSALAAGLVARGEFVFVNCLVVDGRTYRYGWDENCLVVGPELDVASGEYGIAGFHELERVNAGSTCYSCGSTFAHGASGYFFKAVGPRLVWLLVCTSSGAFSTVRQRRDGIEFVSRRGARWVLPAEDVTAVFVEPPEPSSGPRPASPPSRGVQRQPVAPEVRRSVPEGRRSVRPITRSGSLGV
ncbi:MAG: hypothetical protein FWE61_01640 [Micrococcales bacterium]|nr:hypothetical protein [Micrococcales bacterium]